MILDFDVVLDSGCFFFGFLDCLSLLFLLIKFARRLEIISNLFLGLLAFGLFGGDVVFLFVLFGCVLTGCDFALFGCYHITP